MSAHGLARLKRHGRYGHLVLATLGLVIVPVGTVFGLRTIVYLSRRGVGRLVSGTHAAELADADSRDVASLTSIMPRSKAVTAILFVSTTTIALVVTLVALYPALGRAQIAGNESSAINALHIINRSQASYAINAGGGGYALTLRALQAPCPGASAGFIPTGLEETLKRRNGYILSIRSVGATPRTVDCNGERTEADYEATAVPARLENAGQRAFRTSRVGAVLEMQPFPSTVKPSSGVLDNDRHSPVPSPR